ncbi:MAG: hypothetical protein ABI609_16500 [Acidobacteriota bacterium]
MADGTDQDGAPEPVPAGRGSGRFVVMLQGGADRRALYFTAKALSEFWSERNLQEILERLRSQENIILHRAMTREEADKLAASFAALGAKTWVVEQRQIAGLQVF